MEIDEAIRIIQFRKNCCENEISGICDNNCDLCGLNYAQGNMREHIEMLAMAENALKYQKEHQAKVQKCIETIRQYYDSIAELGGNFLPEVVVEIIWGELGDKNEN